MQRKEIFGYTDAGKMLPDLDWLTLLQGNRQVDECQRRKFSEKSPGICYHWNREAYLGFAKDLKFTELSTIGI